MNAVDTNILIYAHDPRDKVKQETAESLLLTLTDGVLLWQVACEFIAASRKLAPLGYEATHAWRDLRKLQRAMTTKLPSWSVMEQAEELLTSYKLSFGMR